MRKNVTGDVFIPLFRFIYRCLSLYFLMLVFFSCKINVPPKEKLNLDFRDLMRQFVIRISEYAHNYNPDFIVIPQNGEALITYNGEANGILVENYISAIDGQGREDLLFGYLRDNQPTPGEERDYMLEFLRREEENGVEVLVTDYCSSEYNMDASYLLNDSMGFISFAADHRDLDNIPSYPSQPYHVNDKAIETLGDARNFLYLINPDNYPTSAALINALSQTDFDLLIIDLFSQDTILTGPEIEQLKIKRNGGKRLVIAYMSIGEAEDYRYYWKSQWGKNPPDWLEAENPSWEGNYKVRYWMPEWQEIILGNQDAYLDRILHAGFDGVYLDIIDAYEYFEENY